MVNPWESVTEMELGLGVVGAGTGVLGVVEGIIIETGAGELVGKVDRHI